MSVTGVDLGVSGLASGVDTSGIVDKLMAIERAPLQRMQLEQIRAETRKSLLGDISTRLTALRGAAADLRLSSIWADTQSVESSDTTRLTAVRVGGAGAGGYEVAITQLARAEQRTYTYTASASATTLTISGVDVQVGANATLDDVVNAINATADVPVYAVAAGGALVLSAKTTGAAVAPATAVFTAGGTTIAEDTTKAKAGQGAIVEVDGVQLTSKTNVTRDLVPGLELTLKALTPSGATVSVSVGSPGPDRDAIKAKLNAFIDQYNSTVDFIRAKLAEKYVVAPTTSGDASSGALQSDDGLQSLLSQMRSLIATPEIASIGISTGNATGGAPSADALAGKLVLDSAKLDAALTADPANVRTIVGAQSGVSGFSQAFTDLLDSATRSDGLLDAESDGADAALARLRDSIDETQRRLDAKEARLKASFAAMESALAQAQAQGNWLAGQLAGLS
jgi:flagellar hook-associated protein 2